MSLHKSGDSLGKFFEAVKQYIRSKILDRSS